MRKSIAFCLGALMLWAASSQAATPFPFADRLPTDTKVYLGWSGRTMVFEGSLMGQLLGEPSVEKLLDAMHKSVEKSLSAEAKKKVFRHGWSMALTAWQRPTAVALIDLHLRGSKGIPGGVALIELGKDQPAFKKDLDGLIDAINEEVPIVETRIGDLPCRAIKISPILTLYFGFDETTFFLTTRSDVLETVQNVKAETSLATSKEFAACMAEVGGENLQAALYLDADAVLKTILNVADFGKGDKLNVARAIRVAGLSKVSAVAAATCIVDRNMYTRARLFTPAPHTGLLAPMTAKPLTDDDLAGIPADADMAIVSRMPLDTLYKQLHAFGRSVLADPNTMTRMESALKQRFDIDLKSDVVDVVGDTWVLCSAPSRGGFLTGTSLSVTLKDTPRAAATVDKIEAIVREHARQVAGQPRSPWNQPVIPKIHVRKTPRADIHTCTFQGGNKALSFIAPSWAIHKNKLHVALWPQVVETITETNGTTPSLTSDETFRAYRKRVSPDAIAMTYVNTPSLLKQMYNIGMVGWTMGASELTRRTGVAFRPGWLPPLKTLQKYMPPSISAISADANGILMEHYGPLPTTGVEMVNTQALLVSIMLPSLHRARNEAKQSVAATRLRALAVAVHIYCHEHKTMPPNLAVLIKGGYMGASQVQSPHATGKPLTFSQDKGFSREPDFVLVPLPPLTQLKNSKKMVLAYERPEFYQKRGTNVAFADGHVTWLTMKEFKAALKATRDATGD